MDTNVTSNAVIAAVLLIRISGCAVAELVDKTINRRNRISLLMANALTAGLMVANCFAISFAGKEGMQLGSTAAIAYRYVAYPVILAIAISLMDTQGTMRMVWALATGNTLLYCTAFFCPLAFYMTSDNRFVPGPLSLVAYVISALFLAQVVALAIRIHRVRREPDTLLPALAVLIFVASSVADIVLGFDYTSRLQIATMTAPPCSRLLFYVASHANRL